LGQENLDKILRAELEKYGCVVEFGVELQTLEQSDSHVQVKLIRHSLHSAEVQVEEGSYEWVIGADGARGAVRKQVGLSFGGETTMENFVVGDMKLDGLDFSVSSFHLSSVGFKSQLNLTALQKWHLWGDMKNVM
jgi:2-polyprenyl-6-methoxyphenol hydroxylase-like FAD-dependent oxidoreductase